MFDSTIVPCKNCIVYPMCINKDSVVCSLLYDHYDEVNYKGGVNHDLLFHYSKALGHTDWTIMSHQK